MSSLETAVKDLAAARGFDLVGITGAGPFLPDERAALERMRAGLLDGLPWLTEHRVRLAARPAALLDGARSVISLAVSHLADGGEARVTAREGRVARYARGQDYHEVVKTRLRLFVADLSRVAGRPVRTRSFVDDGPMLDRAAAARAGLGWFGKNTNILTSTHGSWVFLAQVVTDLALEADRPLLKTCGSCARCIEACPTGAIVAPYVLDNGRCISFLTIEHRGAIPIELRPLVGEWVFGCDVCQEVCPVNRKAAPIAAAAFRGPEGLTVAGLAALLALDEQGFRDRFRASPLRRVRHVGLRRNACVVLGNIGDPSAVGPLADALSRAEPLVRRHAAWALGRIGGRAAVEALRAALDAETEPEVTDEIALALRGAATASKPTAVRQ